MSLNTFIAGNTPSAAIAQNAAAWTQIREFLAFKIDAVEYGIDVSRVQEIRSYEKLDPHFQSQRSSNSKADASVALTRQLNQSTKT